MTKAALFVAQHGVRLFFQLFALVGCEIDRRHDLPAVRLHQRKVDSIGIHAHGDPAGGSAGTHGLRGVGLVIIDSYNLTQRQVQSLLVAWLKQLRRPNMQSRAFQSDGDASDQVQPAAV